MHTPLQPLDMEPELSALETRLNIVSPAPKPGVEAAGAAAEAAVPKPKAGAAGAAEAAALEAAGNAKPPAAPAPGAAGWLNAPERLNAGAPAPKSSGAREQASRWLNGAAHVEDTYSH